LVSGHQRTNADIETAAIEGAVQRLRPTLMTVTAVLAIMPCAGNIVSIIKLKQKDLDREGRQAGFSASLQPIREI
jgi:hypothetical protein